MKKITALILAIVCLVFPKQSSVAESQSKKILIHSHPERIDLVAPHDVNCSTPCETEITQGDEIWMRFTDKEDQMNFLVYKFAKLPQTESFSIPFPLFYPTDDRMPVSYYDSFFSNQPIFGLMPNPSARYEKIWDNGALNGDLFYRASISKNNRYILIETMPRDINIGRDKRMSRFFHLWLVDREKESFNVAPIGWGQYSSEERYQYFPWESSPNFSPDSKWILVSSINEFFDSTFFYTTTLFNASDPSLKESIRFMQKAEGDCEWQEHNPWILCKDQTKYTVYSFHDEWEAKEFEIPCAIPVAEGSNLAQYWSVSWLGETIAVQNKDVYDLYEPFTGRKIKTILGEDLFLYSEEEQLYILSGKGKSGGKRLYFYDKEFNLVGEKEFSGFAYQIYDSFDHPKQKEISCLFEVLLNYPEENIPLDALSKLFGIPAGGYPESRNTIQDNWLFRTKYFQFGDRDPRIEKLLKTVFHRDLALTTTSYFYFSVKSIVNSATEAYYFCDLIQ